MSYNIFNNLLSITAGGTTSGVSSVAGKTGAVSLVSNDITDFQPNVSSNLDVVDNKTKTQNIDKTLTVLNSTKLNGDLIASKFNSNKYYDETGNKGIIINNISGEIILDSNSYINNIGKYLKIDTNGLIIADVPTSVSIQMATLYAVQSYGSGNTGLSYERIRLNIVRGSINGLSLNVSPTLNQFTLTAGNYHLRGHGSSYNVGHTNLALNDVTDPQNHVLIDGDEGGILHWSPISTTASLVGEWYLTLTTNRIYEFVQWTEVSNTGSYGISAHPPVHYYPFCSAMLCITKF